MTSGGSKPSPRPQAPSGSTPAGDGSAGTNGTDRSSVSTVNGTANGTAGSGRLESPTVTLRPRTVGSVRPAAPPSSPTGPDTALPGAAPTHTPDGDDADTTQVSAAGGGPTTAPLRASEVRRLGALVVVLVVLGALVGFGVTFLWPAQYDGRATVLYVITQQDPTGFLREDRNLTTQQLLVQSNAVTAPVAGQFGLTADELAQKMTVSLPDGSELITVDVRDPSQDLATRMAAAVTTQYLQVSAATQPMTDQAKFLQDQLNAVQGDINRLQTENSPASLAQLPAVSQRQSQLAQQLDQVNLAQVAQPTARLAVPAFPVGKVSPRPAFSAATGAVVGLVVAILAGAVLVRRWYRARRVR